ncbi:MAG: MFS transporter [Hadesarchaea archaeon]|nr:MFS transporter [Hadesarchaea archaeon]
MKRYLKYVILFSIVSVLLVAMILPYLPLYGEDLGLSVTVIGYVIAFYHITQVIGRIPLGTLSDHVGYKKIIAVGGLSIFFGTIAYILSPIFWPFMFLAQILMGVAVSTIWVAIPAFMTQFGRGKIPLYTFGIGWAYTLAVPLGGFIKETLGMMSLFYLGFVLTIPLLVLLCLLWRDYPEKEDSNSDLGSFSLFSVYKKSFKTLRNPKILRACLFSFLMFMSFAIGFSLFPLYLSGIGLSSAVIGIVQFSRMGTASSVRLLSKRVGGKLNKERILALGTMLVGFSLALISVINSLPILIIVSIIWGLSGGLYAPIVFDIIADATETQNRGTGMGLRGTMGTLGSSIGVLGFSTLADSINIPISIFLAGITIIIGVGITEAILKRSER